MVPVQHYLHTQLFTTIFIYFRFQQIDTAQPMVSCRTFVSVDSAISASLYPYLIHWFTRQVLLLRKEFLTGRPHSVASGTSATNSWKAPLTSNGITQWYFHHPYTTTKSSVVHSTIHLPLVI